MTSNISLNTGAAASAQTSSSSQQLAQDFNSFLQLLTTQLQNQDPLSPMDSTEFTNQLVQFSQVEQQINQNAKLDSLLTLTTADLTGSALGYLGKDVMVLGSTTHFNGSDEITIDYRLGANTTGTTLRIEDENRVLVRSIEAESTSGTHRAIWDGKDSNGDVLPPGNYTVFVDALDENDEPINYATAVSAKVDGVDTGDGQLGLILEGGTTIGLGSVLSVNQATETGGS